MIPPPINEGATIMKNAGTKSSGKEYKTWGTSRVNRLTDYDYAADRPVHLTICALDKKTVFRQGDEAEALISELFKSAQDLEYKILCYCLMPDHMHVIVSSGDSGVALSKFLNIFKGRTAAVFRKRFGISKLWQKSAYDHVIRAGEDLKTIIQYVLNNPVRNGLAASPEDYPYSRWFEDITKSYL
jgi:REP element-mobilizing transposase RayT